MNFDFTKTLNLIKGGLTDHQTTWENYLKDCPGWQATLISLTGPLILANIFFVVVIGRLMGGFSPYGYHSNFFTALIWGLLLACVSFLIAVFVFNFMAGVFKGKSNFDRSFAAVSMAAIPAWLAGMLAALLPSFIAFLLSLAGGILSLVFMYKIMPLALKVPDNKRVLHFIASLVIIFILNIIAGGIFGGATVATQQQGFNSDSSSSRSSGSGMFGEIERQGKLMQTAEEDIYTPPEDGKLSKSQVKAYGKVATKTRSMHAEYTEKMEALGKEMEAKEARGESPSLADMSKALGGLGGALGANNAEMEIVKTGGGNWAEHSWVKTQLRTARIQQGEGSAAIEHNYKLYQKYSEEIGDI